VASELDLDLCTVPTAPARDYRDVQGSGCSFPNLNSNTGLIFYLSIIKVFYLLLVTQKHTGDLS